MEVIRKYFPDLTAKQFQQLEQLLPLYQHWNEQINVISRKDMDAFYLHHVLHSLGIAKIIDFADGSTILDVGTGGGFPGIPLAILFPNAHFHLVDSRNKKIKVVSEVVEALHLKNVTYSHQRAEKIKTKYDFVISRAVTQMPTFFTWVKNQFKTEIINDIPNGILYLKGGDLQKEMASIEHFYDEFPLADFFEEPFFETKKVVYVQMV